MEQILLQDITLLRCQNAALETELRLVKEQLTQANNATAFLATTFSNAQSRQDDHVARHLREQLENALAENTRLRRQVVQGARVEQRLEARAALGCHTADQNMRAMFPTDANFATESKDIDLLGSYEDCGSITSRIDSPPRRQSYPQTSLSDQSNQASGIEAVRVGSGLQGKPTKCLAADRSHSGSDIPAHIFTSADGSTIEVLAPSALRPSTPVIDENVSASSVAASPILRLQRHEFDQYDRSHLLGRATWLEEMDSEEYAETWTDLGKKKPRHSAEEWQEYYEEIVRPAWYAQEGAKARAAEERERQSAFEAGANDASDDQSGSSVHGQNVGEQAGYGVADGGAKWEDRGDGESSVQEATVQAFQIAASHRASLSHAHVSTNSSRTCDGDQDGAHSRSPPRGSDAVMSPQVNAVATPADISSPVDIEVPGTPRTPLKSLTIDVELERVDSPLTKSEKLPSWKESQLEQNSALPQDAKQINSSIDQFHSTSTPTPPMHPLSVEECDHSLAQPLDRPADSLANSEGQRFNQPQRRKPRPRCCNRPNNEKELEHDNFDHDPSVLRNVEIKGIPPNVLLADILDLVRGGQILGAVYVDLVAMKFRPGFEARSNMAVITFLHARDALVYVQRCRKEPSLLSVTPEDGRTIMLTVRLVRYPILPFNRVSIGDIRNKNLSRVLYLHDDGKHSVNSALGLANTQLGKHGEERWPLRASRDRDGMLVFEFKNVHDAVVVKQAMDSLHWHFGHMPKGFLLDPCQLPFPQNGDIESTDEMA